MKYLKSEAIFLVFFVMASTAWAASPKPSGYLSDYSRLSHGHALEAFWADTTAITPAAEIALGEITEPHLKDKKHVTVEECANWLRRDVLSHSLFSENAPDVKYRLDLAITHMDPGSATKRIMAGELGAGHAQVQVEGKVIDTESGNSVAEFAERRSSSGAIGLEDLKGDSGPELIEHLIKLIGEDVAAEMGRAFSAH